MYLQATIRMNKWSIQIYFRPFHIRVQRKDKVKVDLPIGTLKPRSEPPAKSSLSGKRADRTFRNRHVSPSRWAWVNTRCGEEPGLVRSIVEVDRKLYVDVHTDVVVWDHENECVWKGDLV